MESVFGKNWVKSVECPIISCSSFRSDSIHNNAQNPHICAMRISIQINIAIKSKRLRSPILCAIELMTFNFFQPLNFSLNIMMSLMLFIPSMVNLNISWRNHTIYNIFFFVFPSFLVLIAVGLMCARVFHVCNVKRDRLIFVLERSAQNDILAKMTHFIPRKIPFEWFRTPFVGRWFLVLISYPLPKPMKDYYLIILHKFGHLILSCPQMPKQYLTNKNFLQSGFAHDSIYLTDPNWLRENGQPKPNPTNSPTTHTHIHKTNSIPITISKKSVVTIDDKIEKYFYAFMDIWNKFSSQNQNHSTKMCI